MKAAILHGKEKIQIEDVAPPALKPGEVRIRIEAALTCGTDLKVFKRGYHAKMIVPPAVFGHELAGVISEVADGRAGSPPPAAPPEAKDGAHGLSRRSLTKAEVTRPAEWKIGDRVVVANSAPCGGCFHCRAGQENLCEDLLFLNGAYAESIAVPTRLVQKNLLRLKLETHFRDAALVEPLACVVQGVEDTQLRAGQNVLVIGAGPIGLMFVVLAKNLGCHVTVAGRRAPRLEAAHRLGADEVVDIGAGSGLVTTVREATKTHFDAVIEAVGHPAVWEAAAHLVRKGGVVNFFGGCPSGTTITLDTTLIHYSNLTLLASFHHTPRTIRRALEFIETGVIRAADFVDGECPLTQLPELFKSMAAGNHAIKTLIRVHE
ncbi:MAG: zinc-binding dehydrogenase [Verrucomicrobiota bacterium]